MRLLIVFALAGGLVAQAPPTKDPNQDLPPTIKVNVDIVNILATVRDRHGALVNNLEKNDFAVYEDGKQQTIKYFTRETDVPLTIGLLVDVSASQRNLLDIERNAASEFFAKVLRTKDEAFLIQFGEEAELLQDYTNSARLLTRGLSGLRISSGVSGPMPGPVPGPGPAGTVLYDAVYLAAHEKLSTEVGRKVIVVITDGVDEGSKLPIDQAIEAAQKADAVIYSIEYYDPSAYGGFLTFGGGGGGFALHKLSDQTGGQVFRVDRRHPLDEIFQELQDAMRSQYAIGYTPTNDVKDGSYRKLDLKLEAKQYRNYKIQARKGYYAISNQ